jgi:hypothetical protein
MNIKDLANLYNKIVSEMTDDPENGIVFFNNEWSGLEIDERRVLVTFLSRYYTNLLKQNTTKIEFQMYWAELILNATTPFVEDEPLPILNFPKDEDIKKLVKVFYELKIRGYLDNTNDEIAKIVAKIFDFNYATVFSYLNDASNKFKNVENILA